VSQEEKLILKIKAGGDVRFPEAKKLLLKRGWKLVNVRGSHHTFEKDNQKYMLVRPHGSQKFLARLPLKELANVLHL
jgi:predicted RNA binding protein YcfA (HicA-like mRNA interferase family)